MIFFSSLLLSVLMKIVLLVLQLAMLLWSYFSVVFTDPGSVPPNWNLDFDVETGETAPLASSEFSSQMNSQHSVALGNTGNPRVRYCRKCNQLKPPRCHHCSVCKFMFNFRISFRLFYLWWITYSVILPCMLKHDSGGRCVLKMDHHCVWVVNCIGALNYKHFLLFLVQYYYAWDTVRSVELSVFSYI